MKKNIVSKGKNGDFGAVIEVILNRKELRTRFNPSTHDEEERYFPYSIITVVFDDGTAPMLSKKLYTDDDIVAALIDIERTAKKMLDKKANEVPKPDLLTRLHKFGFHDY